jgi:DNA-directed RNA polymerase subunit RPC12/RpoP
MQAKCLKCKKLFDLDSMSYNEIKKLQKEGCSSCQSKNLEWKMEAEGTNVHFITDECSTCKLAKVIDILN